MSNQINFKSFENIYGSQKTPTSAHPKIMKNNFESEEEKQN